MFVSPPVFTGGPSQGMGSIDLSTLEWQDYALIVFGLVGLYYLTEGAKKVGKKKRSGKEGFAGGLVTAAAVAGGGYLAYKYLNP